MPVNLNQLRPVLCVQRSAEPGQIKVDEWCALDGKCSEVPVLRTPISQASAKLTRLAWAEETGTNHWIPVRTLRHSGYTSPL